MDEQTLITLTADIVSAHVSNNSVSSADVATLIASVHKALATADQPPAVPAPALTPAISIRSSVKADRITCLECGQGMKMLKRHLATDHDLTGAEYKARWKLPADYPLVAPNYAAKRAELAKRIGLGRKPAAAAPAKPAPKARKPRAAKAAGKSPAAAAE